MFYLYAHIRHRIAKSKKQKLWSSAPTVTWPVCSHHLGDASVTWRKAFQFDISSKYWYCGTSLQCVQQWAWTPMHLKLLSIHKTCRNACLIVDENMEWASSSQTGQESRPLSTCVDFSIIYASEILWEESKQIYFVPINIEDVFPVISQYSARITHLLISCPLFWESFNPLRV